MCVYLKNCLLSLKIVAFYAGRDKFTIEKILGEGSYAKVFKGIDMGTQKTVALKIQKPSWEWELYICRQLQSRLSDPLSVSWFVWNLWISLLLLQIVSSFLLCRTPSIISYSRSYSYLINNKYIWSLSSQCWSFTSSRNFLLCKSVSLVSSFQFTSSQ